MAEQENSTSIIMPPKNGSTALVPATSDYTLRVTDVGAGGAKEEITLPAPEGTDFQKWSLLQQAVILKKTTFKTSTLSEIMFAVAYARSQQLDIMAGDVYVVDGRLNTSNKAKIKRALATGRIKGIKATIKTLDDMPLDKAKYPGCVAEFDMECTAVITVDGWNEPVTRTARLSRWYKKSNPNWQNNPEHMLELNTVAHAVEFIAPGETDIDEAPPSASPTVMPEMSEVKKAV